MSKPEKKSRIVSASKSLKIGYVLDDTLDKPDGVQQYVTALGTWMQAQGHSVHYLVGESRASKTKNVHSLSKNLRVRFNGNQLSIPLPASRRAITRLLQTEQFDVLHVQSPHSPFMAQRVIMAAATSTAVVSTFHILPHTRLASIATRLLKLLISPSLARIDHFLAVSDAAAEFARSTLGTTCQVIPNTINLQPFYTATPFERYADKPTILYLNRLEPRKGCIYLLQAVDRLVHSASDNIEFRVVVCGKGSQRATLEAYVRSHNLQEVVSFEGFVSELEKPRYIASADVVAYPSTAGESFGIVLLEGMAASKGVVVAGNNPGYGSVMEPFHDQLVNVKDTDALTALLARSIQDVQYRRRASIAQQKYARQFDISVVGPKIADLYNRLQSPR